VVCQLPRLSAPPSMVRQRLENLRSALRTDIDRARTVPSDLIGPGFVHVEGKNLRGRVSWNAEFVLN